MKLYKVVVRRHEDIGKVYYLYFVISRSHRQVQKTLSSKGQRITACKAIFDFKYIEESAGHALFVEGHTEILDCTKISGGNT